MGGIFDLINNEMPLMLSGTLSHVWMVTIWMISGVIALFTGLNYKEFFNRSNFDLLLLIFLFPVCVLFFNFAAAMLIIGVFFAGRLVLRFADKEQHMPIQLPLWVLVIVFIIGFGFTTYNINKSDVSQGAVEYAIEVQDSILLGEMPYEVKNAEPEASPKLLPGPFAYYISYLPYLIAPITTEIGNETFHLTSFDEAKLADFQVPDPEGVNLITFDEVKKQVVADKKFTDVPSMSVEEEMQKQKTIKAISQYSVKRVNTTGVKILQIFALLILLCGLFAVTCKLASVRLAFFMMILVLFLPWKTVLLGSTWHVLAIGFFLFAVFYLKRTWLSGILLAIAVGINPILLVTLPLFINYYMPNIAKKGYWLISLSVMVFGLIMVIFAPHFKTEIFNFLPMELFGALVIFIGLAFSLFFSFLGNPLKRAPGGFFFAFLIVTIVSFLVVILNTHENSITDTVEIFTKGVLASSFITGASVLKTIAVPLFGLLILFNFLPRNIAQGGLIVLSAVMMFFTIFVLEIPMNGSEFILLLPALFISHLKGSMLAEDKLTSIKLKESIDSKGFEQIEESEMEEENRLYGMSDFSPGSNVDDEQDIPEMPEYDKHPVELDDEGEVVENLNDDDFLSKNAEKHNLMTTNALIEGLETEIPEDAAGSIGEMVEEVLEQKEKEEKEDEEEERA